MGEPIVHRYQQEHYLRMEGRGIIRKGQGKTTLAHKNPALPCPTGKKEGAPRRPFFWQSTRLGDDFGN
ncbi:hypothetical protein, partial [Gallaecimonas xiamenensis]|uniref:hypothetical protein n=1 Tax=Gallaecimonas xiamenensis TaxID=1207039 RepID=UPI001ED9A8C1